MPNVIGTGLSARKGRNDLSDFSGVLDALQALGCETVELPLHDLDVVVGGRLRRPQLDRLRTACADRPLRYTVHGPLAINFFDEPFRLPRHVEVMTAAMEASAEIGAIHYVVHSGLMGVQQRPAIEDAYARQRECLARAGELAESLGLMICVENLFGGFQGKVHTASPSRLAAELKAINHPAVGATLDFSHAYLQLSYDGSADFLPQVQALAPFARHLHIHDSFGRPDDIWMFSPGESLAFGHGDLHLPVGWGDIPWERILETCAFPDGVVFNIELQERYGYEARACLDTVKGWAARVANTQPGHPLAAA